MFARQVVKILLTLICSLLQQQMLLSEGSFNFCSSYYVLVKKLLLARPFLQPLLFITSTTWWHLPLWEASFEHVTITPVYIDKCSFCGVL